MIREDFSEEHTLYHSTISVSYTSLQANKSWLKETKLQIPPNIQANYLESYRIPKRL